MHYYCILIDNVVLYEMQYPFARGAIVILYNVNISII